MDRPNRSLKAKRKNLPDPLEKSYQREIKKSDVAGVMD